MRNAGRAPQVAMEPTNRLIAQLPPADAELLRSRCESVTLVRGQIVGARGASPVCFPETAVLSVSDRSGIEVTMIGPEGMLGWTVMMSGFNHPLPAFVEIGGSALAISAIPLAEVCRISEPVRDAILRFGVAATGQMAATVIATARHQIDRRIARRLLMFHDRSVGDAFNVTHAQLGRALGIRRASVTDWLHILEGEHILRCTRNCVEVLSRPKLEQFAGSAYGQAERAYHAVLGPFGK